MKYQSSFIFCLISFVTMAQWQMEQTPSNFGPRNHPVTFAIDDVGYVLTGLVINQNGSFVYDDMWSYDPAGAGWTQLANFPGGARGFAYGVSYDGKGYVGFGQGPSGNLNDLWEFDPQSNSWRELASCPCSGRRHPAMIAVDGVIYVGMGDDFIVGNLKDWWAYDIASNSWSRKPDLPGPERHHPFYFEHGGLPYVGFGHAGPDIWDDFYRYNPTEETWSVMNFFPGEARVAGTQFSYNGEGYILSGEGSDHFNLETGEFFKYNDEDDSWEELPPHPGGGRWAPGTFVIGNRVYLVAGSILLTNGQDLDLDDMMSYEFPPPASTEGVERSRAVAVYPNPTDDELYLPSDQPIIRADLYSAHGVLMDRYDHPQSVLRTRGLPAGLYVLRMLTEDGWRHAKFEKM